MAVKYSLATALSHHSIRSVVKVIRSHGIIGVDRFGISGSAAKDKNVIEHALSLVTEYQTYENHWYDDNDQKPQDEVDGMPSEYFDFDFESDFHKMGWELEPEFVDTNLSLAKTDPRQYRNQQILIAALCQKHGAIDYAASGSAATVRKLVESIGQTIDEDTVLKYLREIPQALSKKQSE
jgi:hypothetical protein